MKTEEPKSRLDAVRAGIATGLEKRGRLVVGLSKLVEDPRNERKIFPNMEGLVASMKILGLIEPLTVTPQENGMYMIITGHRRYRAAKELGWETIEILIREPEEEKVRRLKSLASNFAREALNPINAAEGLQAALDDYQINQRELAEAMGWHEVRVSKVLKILTLPTPLQERLSSTKVSIGYDAIADIARLSDEKSQGELVDDVLNGATQFEIRQKINELKGKVDPQAAKPKWAYKTSHGFTWILQSHTTKLPTTEKAIESLKEVTQHIKNDGLKKTRRVEAAESD